MIKKYFTRQSRYAGTHRGEQRASANDTRKKIEKKAKPEGILKMAIGAIIWVVVNFGNKKFFTGLLRRCSVQKCTECLTRHGDDDHVEKLEHRCRGLRQIHSKSPQGHFKCVMYNIKEIFWFALSTLSENSSSRIHIRTFLCSFFNSVHTLSKQVSK